MRGRNWRAFGQRLYGPWGGVHVSVIGQASAKNKGTTVNNTFVVLKAFPVNRTSKTVAIRTITARLNDQVCLVLSRGMLTKRRCPFSALDQC